MDTSGGGNLKSSDARVKRIGPQNKGDKIKFGVLVTKADMKRKNSSSNDDRLERHEIFETPKQLMAKQ